MIDLEFGIGEHRVYARANDKGQVEKIFSTCFEEELDTDFLIKHGSGDEFVHVGYYVIYDANLCHNYKIEDGVMVETTEDEKQEELANQLPPPPTEVQLLQRQVSDLEIEIIKLS